jgi:hypothetical protein
LTQFEVHEATICSITTAVSESQNLPESSPTPLVSDGSAKIGLATNNKIEHKKFKVGYTLFTSNILLPHKGTEAHTEN